MKPEKTLDEAKDSFCKIMLDEWSKEEIIEFFKEMMDNKWIPCKERLPESYGKYIVTSSDSVFGIYVRMLNYGEADFAKKNPCWFYYDSEYGDVTVDNVVAWMPLPMPYKESEVYETIKRGLEDAINGRVTEHSVSCCN